MPRINAGPGIFGVASPVGQSRTHRVLPKDGEGTDRDELLHGSVPDRRNLVPDQRLRPGRLVLDRDGGIQDLDAIARTILGMASRQLMGRPLERCLAGDEVTTFHRFLDQVFAQQLPAPLSLDLASEAGRIRLQTVALNHSPEWSGDRGVSLAEFLIHRQVPAAVHSAAISPADPTSDSDPSWGGGSADSDWIPAAAWPTQSRHR